MLPFIITGLVTGAVYGLAAVGLVHTYKTSGVFNFGHGALATVAAYAFYVLHVQHDVGWPLAAALVGVIVVPPLALGLNLLGRTLSGADLATQVVATVGVVLLVQAVVTLIFGTDQSRSVLPFLASGETHIGSTVVQWADILTFAIALAVTAGLYVFLRATRTGTAMRAVVDDPQLLDLAGTSPGRVRGLAWTIGVGCAALAGVLFAPLLPLDPVLLTLLVVQAFGAAALGAFRSLPLAFAGGLVIGVIAALCTKWFTTGVLAGLPPAVPFLVLFVVLLVFPRRLLAQRARGVTRERVPRTAPARVRLIGCVVVMGVLALVPAFAGVHLVDWTTMLGTAILLLSLGLLVRMAGQVSLCHAAFAAIGATAFGHLTTDVGLPWLVALLAAGLIAVPVGALLAVPALRLGGLYLALATFGFGVAVAYMLYTQSFMFGDTGAGVSVPRPGLGLDGDEAYYYVVLAFAVLATGLVVALERGRLGRLLRGMAESPLALATTGVAVSVTCVLVFCLSGFMAAIAGALVGAGQLTVTADSYGPFLSLTSFVVVVIALGREPWYALLGAALLVLVPSYVANPDTALWLQLAFGVAAVTYARWPHGLPDRLADALDRRFAAPGSAVALAPVGRIERPVAPGTLRLEDVTVRFGGLIAVDNASLLAPTGRITGLIGPNGAGKTTMFDVCSGLLKPNHGGVSLDGHSLVHTGPGGRARAGLGRTFQRMELFDTLSVWENVRIGGEGPSAGPNPLRHLRSGRAEERRVREATGAALESCGLETMRGVAVGELSTGQRRLVELARCLAGPFRILLLDEPSSGLDHAETERFGEILQHVVATRGIGVLLVEHDMNLVRDVCDHIYVLDFGRMLFEGSPDDVAASPVVRAAYLGDDDPVLAPLEEGVA
jgi:ABC-type branched-subunit amino acid transport system ATPase component/branched-subunit amino acid ABC-type transport system permease component